MNSSIVRTIHAGRDVPIMCAKSRRARGAAASPRNASNSVNEPDAPKIDSNSLFVQRTLSMARLKLVRDVRFLVFFGIVMGAVAASDTRVAVVWGTGQALTSDDDVGGYALFACVTP